MKAKPLIEYKIGDNLDKKQKSKFVKVKDDGSTQNFVIPFFQATKISNS